MLLLKTNLGRFVFGNTRRVVAIGLLVFLLLTSGYLARMHSDSLRERFHSFRNVQKVQPELVTGYNPGTDPHFINVVENFPSLTAAGVPAVRPENRAPAGAPATPLFIGFTRNWLLLQQSVASYVAAGWPAGDIVVVDNTGTMDSNRLGLLTLQNPFFLNYTRLALLGVRVVATPTLLSFSQLQNFFLATAIDRRLDHYWWSHMDSVAVSWEDRAPYRSLHQNILADWAALAPARPWPWGLKFYRYDRLALVNVAAYKDAGGWDAHIPFYSSDCDFHSRLLMKGYTLPDGAVGHIFDVGGALPDVGDLFPARADEPLDSERYRKLVRDLQQHDTNKHTTSLGRNFWQGQQRGGQGEPFYRNPEVRGGGRARARRANARRASRTPSSSGSSLGARCTGSSGTSARWTATSSARAASLRTRGSRCAAGSWDAARGLRAGNGCWRAFGVCFGWPQTAGEAVQHVYFGFDLTILITHRHLAEVIMRPAG